MAAHFAAALTDKMPSVEFRTECKENHYYYYWTPPDPGQTWKRNLSPSSIHRTNLRNRKTRTHCVASIPVVVNHFTCSFLTWNPAQKRSSGKERSAFFAGLCSAATHKQDYLNTWDVEAYSLIETSIRRFAQVQTHLRRPGVGRRGRTVAAKNRCLIYMLYALWNARRFALHSLHSAHCINFGIPYWI